MVYGVREQAIRAVKAARSSGERVCTTWFKLGRLYEVHTGLAVERALNVSRVLEDLPSRFEALIHILLFDNGAPFLLCRDFFGASTAKLNQFATSSAQRVRPFIWTFGLSYTAGNLVKKVGRGDRTDERGEYVCRKSVESPCEEKNVFASPLRVWIVGWIII